MRHHGIARPRRANDSQRKSAQGPRRHFHSPLRRASDRDEHAYTYDAVGNLTDLAMTAYRGGNTALTHRRLVYDAFGRPVRVAAAEGMDDTHVALYRYKGLNMRLMWQDDADADSTLESSERFYIMHDERWRPVATFRDTDSTPKEAFVWHAAGLFSGAGFQPASYIDSLILRDRDAGVAPLIPHDVPLHHRLRRVQCRSRSPAAPTPRTLHGKAAPRA